MGVCVLAATIGVIAAFGMHSPEPQNRTAPPLLTSAAPPPAMPEQSDGGYAAKTAPATPVIALVDNPLNAVRTGAPEIRCPLPEFDATAEGQQAYLEQVMPCLNDAWQPVLEAANLPFRPADVEVVTSEVQTPCGPRSPTQTALYCAGTIYMTATYYRDIEGHGDTAGVYFGQLAHEYGHHVQELAGIMDASWQQRQAVGMQTREGFETARRFELQATCYGGMFLSSVTGGSVEVSTLEEALRDSGRRGDFADGRPPDHGKPDVNAAWVQTGFDDNSTSHCDTWSVDSARVR